MTQMQVTCQCGWTTTADRDTVVAAVRAHAVEHHRGAAPSEDQILAVATRIASDEEAAAPGQDDLEE